MGIILSTTDLIRRWASALLLIVSLVSAGIWSGCSSRDDQPTTGPLSNAGKPEIVFANLADDVAFVGDDACFGCHETQYTGFKKHGMANAVFEMTAENEIELFDDSVVLDSINGYYYRAFREDGKYWQEEYRLDDKGNKNHSLIREMQLVMGSGISARSYFIQNDGWFFELPISWYTQGQKWDFSPGYRTANKRFDRTIATRCVVCHDAYPDEVPFSDGKYDHIPLGITCERCHGPGELHVDERLSVPEPDSIDLTIVNPSHLSLARKLDVCQQCHMSATVSILREGKTPFDFRPSQDLAEFKALFNLDLPASNEVIGLTSHVGRMKKSECYLGTMNSSSPLECATCHDPHSSFRDSGPEYFNATCVSCHTQESLSDRLAASPSLSDHQPPSNCISCHMPKADLSRVAHSTFTDHWVRVVGRDDEPDPLASHDPTLLIPIFDVDKTEEPNMYTGMAYIVRGRQMRQTDMTQKGIDILEPLMTGDDAYSEAKMMLAIGYIQLGSPADAEPWMEQALAQNPDIPERLNALAQIYESLERDPVKIERLYRRALAIQPARADIRVNYGRFLDARGKLDAAREQYELAIEEREWFEKAYFNLGTLHLRSGEFEEAENRLNEAIDLNPLNPESWSNLGILFARQNMMDAARTAFESGVNADPDSPVALSNLGTFFLSIEENEEAIRNLKRAFDLNPLYVDAAANLALAYFRADLYDLAGAQARKVLEIDAQNAIALQILRAI